MKTAVAALVPLRTIAFATAVAVILTVGAGGSGQVLSPRGFALPTIPDSGFLFQVDGPTGTFAVSGLDAVPSRTSGNLIRAF
jgi:hypothetical protein